MADNFTLNAGTGGAVLATDDVGSVHYPINKLAHGALDSVTLVSLTDGLPIQNDDTDLKVTLDGEAVVLAAGSAAIGKLAANSGVDIGDVDVLSSALPTGAATSALQTSSQAILTTIDADTGAIKLAVEPGAGGNSKTQDFPSGPADVGVGAMAIRKATPVNTSGADGDYEFLQMSAGRLWASATIDAALPAGSNSIGTVVAAGAVAHDGVDSGNPLKIGGKAYSFDGTPPQTAVAEADRVNAIFTPQGRQYVETTHPNYWSESKDYASAQTNTTIKAAPGAGLKLYITDVIVSNGATAGNITLLNGSGGTVVLELYPAINGGLTHSFRTPLALTANTLLAITSTTVTTHSVTISGFIAA